MRYIRLIIAEGPDQVDLSLHPRLNVISGIDEEERSTLADQLLGALDGTKHGVGLEVETDDGRLLVVLRGVTGEEDQVMELPVAKEVTEQFVAPDGHVDLMGTFELHKQDLRSVALLTPHHAEMLATADPSFTRLARLDQSLLWQTASEFRTAKYSLETRMGANAESTELEALVNEELEAANKGLKAAVGRHRLLSRVLNIASLLMASAGVFLALLLHFAFLALCAVPLVAKGLKARSALRLQEAREREQEVLAAAGADSYLGYRLSRKEGPTIERHEVVPEETAWKELCGDISFEWALSVRSKVEELSAWVSYLRDHGFHIRDDEDAFICGLVMLLADIGRTATHSMILPLIIDDGFISLEPRTKGRALQLLSATAGSPQIIYLSNDPDIRSWGQSLAVRGVDMLLIAPAEEASEA